MSANASPDGTRAWLSFTAHDGSSSPSMPRFRVDTDADAGTPPGERASDVILTPQAAIALARDLLHASIDVQRKVGLL